MQSTFPPFWIIAGDLHGKLGRLDDIPGLSTAAGILITGDITTAGGAASARNLLEKIQRRNPRVLALFGNMDRSDTAEWLEETGQGLHRKVFELTPETAVMGLGGSNFTPFGTPSEFSEASLEAWLEDMWRKARAYRQVILLSHTPPYGTKCDHIGNGRHAGSQAVRNFILECQPAACLCGHIHEARAEDMLGKTLIVNPGSLNAGGYAVLTPGHTPLAARHLL
ncbi:MAG: metallophosphoesterase family protein [Desulfovibrionaceae bacterium]|nr:metallophosphoesterase family protein [Desulfovibrionaceae bacterium]